MNNFLFVIWSGIITGIAACNSQTSPEIMTVLGPIPASEIGTTLAHEHILVDFIGADSTGFYGSGKNKFIPSRAFDMSPEELADEWTAELIPALMQKGFDNEDIERLLHHNTARAFTIQVRTI